MLVERRVGSTSNLGFAGEASSVQPDHCACGDGSRSVKVLP